MKLMTFEVKGGRKGESRIGALLDDLSVLSLQAAVALYLKEKEKEKDPYGLASRYVPDDMLSFLGRGKLGMDLARRCLRTVSKWQRTEKRAISGVRKEPLIFPSSKVSLRAPVPRPGKIVAMGLNFRDHAEENKVPIRRCP